MREEIVQLVERLLDVRREIEAPGSSGLPTYMAASDLHGSVRRLREVFAAAEREAIDHLYLVGDLYSGPGGWAMYRALRDIAPRPTDKITLMWGNHEVALVDGMLGNDKQLRFFLSYGGEEMLRELNEERKLHRLPLVRFRETAPVPQEAGRMAEPSPPRLTPADLARVRDIPELQEMSKWIQETHRLFVTDAYGTGYLHAFPRINRAGQFMVQYQGEHGIEALPSIEADFAAATRSDHPVFSALLQTDTSPVWSLFEISSAAQFDHAIRTRGVRQIVFGHRHHTDAVNVGKFNRQIGIAVDFDRGLGGYLKVGPDGMSFFKFTRHDTSDTQKTELIFPVGDLSPRETHLRDVEEFLFGRLVEAEKQFFDGLPTQSAQARHEFEYLEKLREKGVPWIHRLYAEIYLNVKDLGLRKQMFSATVASGDEDAFRSFIHLLYAKTRDLESYGHEWYGEQYMAAKSVAEVLMRALGEMPVARLGLLDVRLRGMTSRVNLTELYKRVMELEDPDLALLAVQNLGMLETPEAGVELRRAFFHDVRKVRVRAAEVLASQGEVVYPLVVPLLRSPDIWVRFLAMWTLVRLPRQQAVRAQAILDLRRHLQREQDWFLYVIGKEFLRELGDDKARQLPDRLEIPNLTYEVINTLQQIVDSEREPYRRSFKVYFITMELSSVVYRRGLAGLDIDDLKIYVSNDDYFPPYFRHYKSGDWDVEGIWRGWRRLWIRGETPNQPDGPQIIAISPSQAAEPPVQGLAIVLYDHRNSNGRVQLPDLDDLIARHGWGKVKDRIRHSLLEQWESAFTVDERAMLCRLHAAAMTKMLFAIPAELSVTGAEWRLLETLSQRELGIDGQKSYHVLVLKPESINQGHVKPATTGEASGGMPPSRKTRSLIAHPQWLDVPKYAVHVRRADRV